MTHCCLRLCAVFGTIGIAGLTFALALAAASVWDAARGGRLVTLTWGPAQ